MSYQLKTIVKRNWLKSPTRLSISMGQWSICLPPINYIGVMIQLGIKRTYLCYLKKSI